MQNVKNNLELDCAYSINISKIPEIIDHIKSEHFICFFIFFL